MTTSEPHRTDAADHDYHSIELMRLRARVHNGSGGRQRERLTVEAGKENPKQRQQRPIDLDEEASSRSASRTEDLTGTNHPRTSKIMNTSGIIKETAAGSKDKFIFVRTVPKGSLTTTTVMSSQSVSSSTPASLTSSSLPSTASTTVASTTISATTTEQNTDDYYEDPTELIDERDVVKASETRVPPRPETSSEAVIISPILAEATVGGGDTGIPSRKPIDDRPIMAPVIQNPPNENSIIRKDLKPLGAKDVQVSFILPAVTEPAVDTKVSTKQLVKCG